MIRKTLGEYWEKISMIVAVPLGLGFVVLVTFGQMCVDNLPYLTC